MRNGAWLPAGAAVQRTSGRAVIRAQQEGRGNRRGIWRILGWAIGQGPFGTTKGHGLKKDEARTMPGREEEKGKMEGLGWALALGARGWNLDESFPGDPAPRGAGHFCRMSR